MFTPTGKKIKQKAVEAKKTLKRMDDDLKSKPECPNAKIFKKIVKTKRFHKG